MAVWWETDSFKNIVLFVQKVKCYVSIISLYELFYQQLLYQVTNVIGHSITEDIFQSTSWTYTTNCTVDLESEGYSGNVELSFLYSYRKLQEPRRVKDSVISMEQPLNDVYERFS